MAWILVLLTHWLLPQHPNNCQRAWWVFVFAVKWGYCKSLTADGIMFWHALWKCTHWYWLHLETAPCTKNMIIKAHYMLARTLGQDIIVNLCVCYFNKLHHYYIIILPVSLLFTQVNALEKKTFVRVVLTYRIFVVFSTIRFFTEVKFRPLSWKNTRYEVYFSLTFSEHTDVMPEWNLTAEILKDQTIFIRFIFRVYHPTSKYIFDLKHVHRWHIRDIYKIKFNPVTQATEV